VPNTAVYRLQEGSLVLTQEGLKAVVYRLQEGSLGVAQEGAKSSVNWLQEGSLGATQEGVDGVGCWPQEGGLVVVQAGINGDKGTASGVFLSSAVSNGGHVGSVGCGWATNKWVGGRMVHMEI
jgi:hypothetical protein